MDTSGHQVVRQLAKRGAKVLALTRDPAKTSLPAGTDVVQGDSLNVDPLSPA